MKHPRHIVWLSLALSVLLSACQAPVDGMQPVTDRGEEVIDLFEVALWISAFVLLLVFGLLAYILLRFRSRPGDEDPPQRTGNRRLEIFWTATPVVLLIGLFVYAIETMLDVEDSVEDPLRIEVIGNQWWWEFRYPDHDVETANELHIPVGVPLRFEITSDDVLHNFWVPRFGWKLYMIPEKVNVLQMEVEEAGIFEGSCGEYCGVQHAWMRFLVIAESPEDFEDWVAVQSAPAEEPAEPLAERGQEIFLESTCVNCHAIDGTPADGQVGPELTHVGSRSRLGAGVVPNTPENLAEFILHPQDVKPGILMPSYSYTEEEILALVAYLEGLE